MRFRSIISFAAILLTATLPYAAQAQDRAGTKDPALLTRMPGFFIDLYKDTQFDAHEFTVQKGKGKAEQHAEGDWTQWSYVPDPAAGPPPASSRINGTIRMPY